MKPPNANFTVCLHLQNICSFCVLVEGDQQNLEQIISKRLLFRTIVRYKYCDSLHLQNICSFCVLVEGDQQNFIINIPQMIICQTNTKCKCGCSSNWQSLLGLILRILQLSGSPSFFSHVNLQIQGLEIVLNWLSLVL
jgi:hypothetical protein